MGYFEISEKFWNMFGDRCGGVNFEQIEEDLTDLAERAENMTEDEVDAELEQMVDELNEMEYWNCRQYGNCRIYW